MTKKTPLYKNGATLRRGGASVPVAGWVKDLTKEAQAMIGRNDVMAPYSRDFRKRLTDPSKSSVEG